MSPWRKVRRVAAWGVGAAVALSLSAWYALPWAVESPELPPLPASAVWDRDGKLIGLLRGADRYRCEPLPEGEPLPPQLVRALLAAEDTRFFSHGGVDLPACARALYERAAGRSRSGASTLTMQLAKLTGGGAGNRTWRTKLREMLQARRLTMELGRERVLREYLNRADFGNLCRGAEAASRAYFGCPAHELTVPQAALLAALVQAPTRLAPLRHPQAALARRNHVLRRMGEKAATAEPLGLHPHALAVPGGLTTEAGQLTLDLTLQERCREIAEAEMDKLRAHKVGEAAIAVLDNRSGELLVAMGPVNMPRSAGSTLKPFAYMYAFSKGAWPGTIMPDVPTLYPDAAGIGAPTNYLHHYLGPITVRQALACSQNIPAMEALGNSRGVADFLVLLRRFGYTVPGTAEEFGLGLAIGNAHVTLLEQVRAYAALARAGSLSALHSRLPHGDSPATTPQLGDCPPAHLPLFCAQLADILSDPLARLEGFGLAPELRFPFACAVKTGTSSNYRDNWCIGFTAQYTVGVWVGNRDNSPMVRVSGLSGAGPIFHRVFELLAEREQLAGRPPLGLPPRPEALVEVDIDRRTGLLMPPDCPQSQPWRVRELAIRGHEPKSTGRYDERGRAMLDSRYAEWLPQSGQEDAYALDAAAPSSRAPVVLVPAAGSIIMLDPALPRDRCLLELRSTLPPATARWYSDTLRLHEEHGRWWAELVPGRYRLLVADEHNGLSAQVQFTVEDTTH